VPSDGRALGRTQAIGLPQHPDQHTRSVWSASQCLTGLEIHAEVSPGKAHFQQCRVLKG